MGKLFFYEITLQNHEDKSGITCVQVQITVQRYWDNFVVSRKWQWDICPMSNIKGYMVIILLQEFEGYDFRGSFSF